MSKRDYGKFKRRKQDAYDTPKEAVLPLLPHLTPRTSFVEPCAGKGDLVKHLEEEDHVCLRAFDIEPRGSKILKHDALSDWQPASYSCSTVITNPPWSRKILHPMIDKFIELGYTSWLLFDADWMHTKQSVPYLDYCDKIVSVGRVSWMNNGVSGFDNCAWYKFRPTFQVGPAKFYGRI